METSPVGLIPASAEAAAKGKWGGCANPGGGCWLLRGLLVRGGVDKLEPPEDEEVVTDVAFPLAVNKIAGAAGSPNLATLDAWTGTPEDMLSESEIPWYRGGENPVWEISLDESIVRDTRGVRSFTALQGPQDEHNRNQELRD